MKKKLPFAIHAREIAGRASRKLSSKWRISSSLDHKGCWTRYKSQPWPLMETCPETWSICSNTNLYLLNVIQRRGKRLIDSKTPPGSGCLELQPLHNRREVPATCVFYKIHTLNDEQINSLEMDGDHFITHNIRGFQRRKDQLHVPFAKTEQAPYPRPRRSTPPIIRILWHFCQKLHSLLVI